MRDGISDIGNPGNATWGVPTNWCIVGIGDFDGDQNPTSCGAIRTRTTSGSG
jgi:hypothetical protein